MLKASIEKALNKQIAAEKYSSYFYLAISAWFERQNLIGMARWMRIQAGEEDMHAMKIFDFVLERGGTPKLEVIDAPPVDWKSPADAFEEVYKHEVKVTGLINKLVDLSVKESDHATNNFLQWFVAEQVEEESNADEIVQRLKLVKDNGNGLLMVDQELKNRPDALGILSIGQGE